MTEHAHKEGHEHAHTAGHEAHPHKEPGHVQQNEWHATGNSHRQTPGTHDILHTTTPQGQNQKQNGTRTGYSVRGAVFSGIVVSAKAPKTVTVQRILTKYIRKYERYKKTKSKVKAHNPEHINAREGDTVMIGETRKLSKTKNFMVMEIIKKAGQ